MTLVEKFSDYNILGYKERFGMSPILFTSTD